MPGLGRPLLAVSGPSARSVFGRFKVRFFPKADIQITAAEKSARPAAFPPKADVRLILAERSANDPKRTSFAACVTECSHSKYMASG